MFNISLILCSDERSDFLYLFRLPANVIPASIVKLVPRIVRFIPCRIRWWSRYLYMSIAVFIVELDKLNLTSLVHLFKLGPVGPCIAIYPNHM